MGNETKKAYVFIRTSLGLGSLQDSATIMVNGSELETIFMAFQRGLGQPDGIHKEEAIDFGKAIGKHLKSKGVRNFHIIEGDGETMEENPKRWYSGNPNDYSLGVELSIAD